MTILPIITGCLTAALMPIERWEALKSFGSEAVADNRFLYIGLVALAVLIVLYIATGLYRTKQERKSSKHLFFEFARKRGLSTRECQILLIAAQKAGLKRSESVFTLNTAFEQGTARLFEELQADPHAVEESNQLRMELNFLREKLGFEQKSSPGTAPANSAKLSSRQIPIGKKIHITRRKALSSGEIEATVVENNDRELGIRLAEPVKITFGETWCARYYFRSSVWEFDTTVVSFDGDKLVLSHSEDVRFINRRRFLRVPVKMSAFIACFPFEKMAAVIHSSDNAKEQAEDKDSTQPATFIWGPPEFIPAIVTELAGPGLRIESPLETKVGDRVVVVFSLSQNDGLVAANHNSKMKAPKIIECMGEVRHIRPSQDGFSVAVELTALSDSDTDELIRATNEASVHGSKLKEHTTDFEDAAQHASGALNA